MRLVAIKSVDANVLAGCLGGIDQNPRGVAPMSLDIGKVACMRAETAQFDVAF